ncbi:AraC family transcriptional regulator [Chryseobacterium lactis]|uniref:AraC family transcriptional regulator n=1 Tax=Chryseobacterium lactis TaxID=1241981 RepID=A0A3G6RJW7_CHRLC|nr:helix-turn-helix domain-containing protein [Chryseobacterium lactis]AZA83106.1 AraC family transcriptional regulator [Chryseobacterium lactis]AZB03489.1 AraC family transcriptional regulator [Chryseobacterium lactis]PNW12007.1 AraC family transcriptional regulator [Chryseobacterium lactis]
MATGWQLIYVAGISISLFLFIMLISKRKKTGADKILSIWFFFALVHLIFIAWYASGLAYKTPVLVGWELPLPFLHGPFLYLYILFLSGQQRYRRFYLLHFIPAILVAFILAFVLPEVHSSTSALSAFTPLFHGMVTCIMISGVVYVILSLILLNRHQRNIVGQFSNTDKITLNWMRYLISGMGVIWIVVIFTQSAQALYVAVALFIFFIGYFGIRQTGIFSDILSPHEVFLPTILETSVQSEEPDHIAASADRIKYEKTKVDEDKASEIQAQLVVLMEEQESYKDPELTLGDLAGMLNIPPGTLSQVINSKEGKNFYDYINTFRIEAFKQLLSKPESRQYTLLSLAFECGFNSKTSFNRNFKKITGISPSVYAKNITIDISSGE